MWDFSEINDATGFANGDLFDSESEVRTYFTTSNMVDMFGPDNCDSQEVLDEMADTVIKNRWYMN